MSRYGPSSIDAKKPKWVYHWRDTQRNILESFPIAPSKEWFQNTFGMYRWHLIRAGYADGIIDADFVTDLYCDWRDTAEFYMLEGLDADDNIVMHAFLKAAKRGNDIYKSKINQKFSFFDKLPNREFFKSWGRKTSPMLFITLTVDPKKYTLNEAWYFISQEFNRFETLLRQKYGYFVKFRVWESHESGYPHVHIIYYFHTHSFELWEDLVIPEDGSDPKQYYRVHKSIHDSINNMWSMGSNIDIQGVQDTLGALNEVKKYVTKTIWSDKADKTNAMLTLFNKQSYHISLKDPYKQIMPSDLVVSDLYLGAMANVWASQDFIGSIWGVDWYLRIYDELYLKNENLAEPGLNALVSETMYNYNIEFPEIVKWRFVGFVLGVDLACLFPKNKDDWVFVVKDPPPDLYAFVTIRDPFYL